MDKFDTQIALLRPKDMPAQLDERQFMKKLLIAQRSQRNRRVLLGSMAATFAVILGGALSRNIFEIVRLTVRYINELPALLHEYAQAYVATISWPGLIATVALGALLLVMFKTRNRSAADTRTYRFAAALAILALSFSIAGLFSSPGHASAAQQKLKRRLNEKGHLEVRVDGKDYELYGKSRASDQTIRNQALIQKLRTFDYKKIHPELTNISRDGMVVEIRKADPRDTDCQYFYVERRFGNNKTEDANSGCFTASQKIYYFNDTPSSVSAQTLRQGQAVYVTYANIPTDQSASARDPYAGTALIMVLLSGKADDYVAASGDDKLVPKGQPGQGTQSCGINLEDDCPEAGGIDVFTNGQGFMPNGETGASVTGDSFSPRPSSSHVRVFGKITELDNSHLQLITPSKRVITINWQRNVIAEFNASGAKNYPTNQGPLAIQAGDSLSIDISYVDGMDLSSLKLSDVQFISLAIKTTMADPLNGEVYDKEKAMNKGIQKY